MGVMDEGGVTIEEGEWITINDRVRQLGRLQWGRVILRRGRVYNKGGGGS